MREGRDWSPHVILGLSEEGFDELMENRNGRFPDGVPITLEPRWHAHPVLGITGHAHGTVADARTPHVHSPRVEWDDTVPLVL